MRLTSSIAVPESAIRVWEKSSFEVAEKMGKYTEEGISHMGIFVIKCLESIDDIFQLWLSRQVYLPNCNLNGS